MIKNFPPTKEEEAEMTNSQLATYIVAAAMTHAQTQEFSEDASYITKYLTEKLNDKK